jgi:hypothetical protein
MRRWAPVALAAPAIVLCIVLVACLALATAGAHPFWQWQPLTLSEAAALRDAGEVARLLREGQDPNRAYPVRADLLSSRGAELTPMQAALAARRPEIVQLLVAAGVPPPP